MLESLPPRYFCDFSVPERENGSPLTSCEQAGDYERYVHWLADYLHHEILPLSTEQQDWLVWNEFDPGEVVFWCSEIYGYMITFLEDLEEHFANGESFKDYRAKLKPLWEERAQTPEEREEWSFEEFLMVDEENYVRLQREWQQEQATDQLWSHADIPFRSLLNRALRQIPDHAVRYRELDHYFQNFQDNASK